MKSCPWINTAVLSAIAKRASAWPRSRRAPENYDLRFHYKTAPKKANALWRSDKRKYFQGTLRSSEKKNPTKNWGIPNNLRACKRKNFERCKTEMWCCFLTLADDLAPSLPLFSRRSQRVSRQTVCICTSIGLSTTVHNK